MKFFIFVILSCCSHQLLYGQDTISETTGTFKVRKPVYDSFETAQVFTVVEQMPVFPGGDNALRRVLASIPYPQAAIERDIEGIVYVKFIVDETGQVTDATIMKGADRLLNEAALNFVWTMPRWTPGRQNGVPVKVALSLPVNFKLD